MNVVTPEKKRLAEIRSKHDTLFKLENSLYSIIENPKISKKNLDSYNSQIDDSKYKRQIIVREMKKLYNAIARKKEHERRIKAGEENTLYEIEQKIEKLEIQKQRFITDLKNLENSNQIFDKQTRINNINNIYKEQEVLMELHNKIEREEKELLN
jgi:predicted GNAT family acetyltransferase